MAGASVFYPARSMFPVVIRDGGPSFDPSNLFFTGNGDYWDARDPTLNFTDALGTVQAVQGDNVNSVRTKLTNTLYVAGSPNIGYDGNALFNLSGLNSGNFVGARAILPAGTVNATVFACLYRQANGSTTQGLGVGTVGTVSKLAISMSGGPRVDFRSDVPSNVAITPGTWNAPNIFWPIALVYQGGQPAKVYINGQFYADSGAVLCLNSDVGTDTDILIRATLGGLSTDAVSKIRTSLFIGRVLTDDEIFNLSQWSLQ